MPVTLRKVANGYRSFMGIGWKLDQSRFNTLTLLGFFC